MSRPLTLSPKEIQSLLEVLQPGNGSAYQKRCAIRNTAIALLMLDAGCRASEVCRLTYEDAYWDGQVRETLHIRDTIAKYHIGGQIPISRRLATALENLRIAYHPDPLRSNGHHLIYIHTSCLPVSRRHVHRIIKDAAREAIGRSIYPHLLRHTFGDTMRRVCDLPTLQKLMRHKHLSSTQIYTHPEQTELRAAIDKAAALQTGDPQ